MHVRVRRSADPLSTTAFPDTNGFICFSQREWIWIRPVSKSGNCPQEVVRLLSVTADNNRLILKGHV
jgi:hypothetical protein